MKHESQIAAVNVHPAVARLTAVRLAWELSTQDVAKRIGCSWFSLMHMESGQKQPSFKTLLRWAEVLGFEVSLWPKSIEDCVHRVPEISGVREA